MAWKSIAKVPNQKVARQPKCFSFFFFSQASSKLCNSFAIAFAQNSSILPIAFTQLWSLMRQLELVTEQLCLHLRCMHACTQMKRKYYSGLLNYIFIRNKVVCMNTGRAFVIHCWFGVWTEPGQCFQPSTAYTSAEEGCEDRLQLNHAPAEVT